MFSFSRAACSALALILVAGPVAAAGVSAKERSLRTVHTQATWYGPGFYGRATASGERFNPKGFTAAHPTLPLGTVLEVSRPGTDKKVTVRINDRCRCTLDLTRTAAEKLGIVIMGRAPVQYVVSRDGFVPQPEGEVRVKTRSLTGLPSLIDLNVVY